VAVEILTRDSWIPQELRDRMRFWTPQSNLGQSIKEALAYLPAEQALDLFDKIVSCCVIESSLAIKVFRHPDSRFWSGELVEDYGIVSRKVVTTAGVTYIAADIAGGANDSSNFKYHALGTGSSAEAAGETALVTELTTEYTGNVRATGNQSSVAGAYTTVGTNTLDSGTPALREHGIFTQAATGGGTLLDRSLYAAINLDGTLGEALQSTYVLTLAAGG
jgi:hypothetical protein